LEKQGIVIQSPILTKKPCFRKLIIDLFLFYCLIYFCFIALFILLFYYFIDFMSLLILLLYLFLIVCLDSSFLNYYFNCFFELLF